MKNNNKHSNGGSKNEELYFKSQGYETRVGTINARLDTCIYIYYYLLYRRNLVLGFLKVIKELCIYSLIVLLNRSFNFENRQGRVHIYLTLTRVVPASKK